MDVLRALQDWYAAHCDGCWEEMRGVKITTCDNPGWWVKVDLAGTELEIRPFVAVAVNVDADGFQKGDRWLCCRVENAVWHGAGDETKLPEILEVFLSWANGS